MIRNIELFVRVADCGSFTAVAHEYAIGQPAVSKAVQALERQLGARIFHRNTRGLVLTEEGRAAYDAALQLLDAYESLVAAPGTGSGARGTVKLALPMALGSLYVLPALKPLLAAHPELVVDMRLDDAFVDLVADGIDIAVRVGDVKDSRLAARPAGMLQRRLVAGCAYLEEHGEPRSPAELRHHQCIVHGTRLAQRQWGLRKQGRKVTVAVSGNIVIDNILGIRAAVAENLGIARVGTILTRDLVQDGMVRVVLADYELDPLPVTILFPDNKYVPMRVRRVIDHLAESVGAALAGCAS